MLESEDSRPSVMRRDCRSLTSLPLCPGLRFLLKVSAGAPDDTVGTGCPVTGRVCGRPVPCNGGQERVNRTLSTILASAPKAESRPRMEVIWDSVRVGRQVTPGGGGVGGVGACPPKFPPEIWEGEGGS